MVVQSKQWSNGIGYGIPWDQSMTLGEVTLLVKEISTSVGLRVISGRTPTAESGFSCPEEGFGQHIKVSISYHFFT